MQIRIVSASAVWLLSSAIFAAGCQEDPGRNAPVTTQSPSGQSTAPAAAAAERRDTALVRVVHAVPSAPAVDVLAGDNRVFESVAFKTVTPYRELDGERYTFRLNGAGSAGDPIATNTEGLDDGDYYTVFAVPGDRGRPLLRVVEDDNSAVEAGKVRVRVVHAAADVGEIDVRAAGARDDLFDGVDFQRVTDYDEFDPIAGILEIRPSGAANVLMSVPDVRFEPGSTYTVVVVSGGGAQQAFVIRDRSAVEQTR